MKTDFQGYGVGLRQSHYSEVEKGRSSLQWFEIISENYMIDGGRPKSYLEKIRREYPISCHGVSLNIGSSDPLDISYLKKLKELVDRVEPMSVSDHLCWTGMHGENLHDLFPLPYRMDVADYVAARIRQTQDFLKRRILIENVSSYMTFKNSEMTEWDFISEVARKSGCGILLDVNNVYVSSVNHGFDPMDYINAMNKETVGQIHLAGHSVKETPNGRFLIDTHSDYVCDEVWVLYGETIKRLGPVNTMVEWDADIPSFETLEKEVLKAKTITDRCMKHAKSSRAFDENAVDGQALGSI